MVRHTIKQVGREARQFRCKHGLGAHLPRNLREAAAQLAAVHETQAIIRELEISGETLRRWKERYTALKSAVAPDSSVRNRGATKPATVRPLAKIKKIDVVEIKTSGLTPIGCPEGSTSVVELMRPDGWTMRVTGDLARGLATAMVGKFTL
jgi:hypothetical protein